MFSQLIHLALLPLAVLAAPGPEPLIDHDLFCFRREPDLSKFRNDGTATGQICDTLTSGRYVFNADETICRVKDYDVKWFQERCQSHVDEKAPKGTKFSAGTTIQTPLEFDLYCFSYPSDMGKGPHSAARSRLDIQATKDVCGTLSSGKYQDEPTKRSCRVASYDVQWFTDRCAAVDKVGRGFYAGTDLEPVIDLSVGVETHH